MNLLDTIIGLIFLIILSNILSHFIRQIPVSLIQIALGLVAALFFHVEIDLHTEWFLLLFVAPLIYSDAWRFPKKELWELRGPIFGNAILLVFITTIVGGYLITWMIPQVPLVVGFAIAAILSPTDPVAVQSIAKQTALPKRILHVVSGESLINDASGLVGFNVAVVAATVGTFSLFEAAGEFFYESIMGAIVGLVVGYLINWLTDLLVNRGNKDIVFQVAMQLASPFLIYMIAESVHASGVIAVVTGAIIANLRSKNDLNFADELLVLGWNTWSVFAYFLNGFLFLILGIELPVALPLHGESGPISVGMMVLFAFGTWIILFLIRFIWLYLNQWFYQRRNDENKPVSLRVILISTLSGVRGAITMAGVMSVPLVTNAGVPFPQRRLMLFIAAVVIIISLVVAIIFLPLVAGYKVSLANDVDAGETNKQNPRIAQHMTEDRAQIYALQSAMREIENQRYEANQVQVYELITRYQAQIRRIQLENLHSDRLSAMLKAEYDVRELTLKTERRVLRQLFNEHKIASLVYQSESRRLDRIENNLQDLISKEQSWSKASLRRAIVYIFRNIRVWLSDEDSNQLRAQYQLARKVTAEAVIETLNLFLNNREHQLTRFEQQAAYSILISYQLRLEDDDADTDSIEVLAATTDLELAGLNAQRAAVQDLYDAHFIDYQTSLKIRQTINFAEAALLADEE
ncbi:Na(+)/H(+) antiporter [Weissella oryzae SG25]|uniref:Na(+)/H(+) antiporter n=1 Tax=Weissella oryzae (strain DSM 25784 / JCM 18191 / LMG 30913 / SG25) TaxID=1329250 RepID=A0A069CW43_WEIOS|nr:Na+/H+ antiporter [Weissella oryzae]GAK31443.1 Na(+)/H(+) antiporter [Weissella oryzae SG25]